MGKEFPYLQKPAFPMSQGRALALSVPFIISNNVEIKGAEYPESLFTIPAILIAQYKPISLGCCSQSN